MRTAPGIGRAVAILNLMAAAPGNGVSLSEVSRRTGFPKATCHAVLLSLVEARWAVRHPDGPTYRLGPALIALGEAAGRGFPALPFAEDAARVLGEETGLECLITAAVAGEIVVLAKLGVAAPLAVSVSVGQRLPLVPPLAGVFLAWDEPDEVAELFADTPPDALARYQQALATVRERGYAIGAESGARQQLGRLLADGAAEGRATVSQVEDLLADLGLEDYHLTALRSKGSYRLANLAAPIFDAGGRVSMALTLVGFVGDLTGVQVRQLGQRLVDAAAAATAASLGAGVPAAVR